VVVDVVEKRSVVVGVVDSAGAALDIELVVSGNDVVVDGGVVACDVDEAAVKVVVVGVIGNTAGPRVY
jgi:hypothetical protein